jgi:hypothetical protein
MSGSRYPVLLVAAGGAVAAMVGGDGALGWQITRVAVVAALTAAALAGVGRLGDRGGGWVSAVVGTVVLAASVGFLPYPVKETASLEALAGITAVVVGLALVVMGTCRRARGRSRFRRARAGTGRMGVPRHLLPCRRSRRAGRRHALARRSLINNGTPGVSRVRVPRSRAMP